VYRLGHILLLIIISGYLNSIYSLKPDPDFLESPVCVEFEKNTLVFSDKTSILSYDKVLKLNENLFLPFSKSQKVFKTNSKNAIWLKVDIRELPSRSNYYVVFDDNYLKGVELFISQTAGGYIYRKYNDKIFQLVPANNSLMTILNLFSSVEKYKFASNEVYLRVFHPENDFNLSGRIADTGCVANMTARENSIHYAYLGIVFAMILYNLILYLILRKRAYIYYVLFTAIYTVTVMGFYQFLIPFFFETAPARLHFVGIASSLALIFGLLFARSFLDVDIHIRKLRIIYKLLIYLILSSLLVRFFSMKAHALLFNGYLALGSILVLYTGIKLYKKYSYARDFTHAWIFFLMVQLFFATGGVSGQFLFKEYHLMEIAHAIEAILLSLVLARRIQYLENEQKKYLLMQRDVDFASETQRYLFPQSNPSSSNYGVYARYLPSAKVSGDFYDFYVEDSGALYVLIVDVAGHGYTAGLIATMIKIAFHESINNLKDLADLQKNINRIMFTHTDSNFATALIVKVEPSKKEVSVIRSGHTPLLYIEPGNETVRQVLPRGLPIGVVADYSIRQESFIYKSGGRVVLFTDGITEQTNPIGQEYGMERFCDSILEYRNNSGELFCDEIFKLLENWRYGQFVADDMTLVVLDLF